MVSRAVIRIGAAIGTTLGTGFSPVAPGTVGSLVAFGLWLLFGADSTGTALVVLAALIPLSLAGAAAGEALWGRDPGRVNIDEVLGTWIACMPAGGSVVLAAAGLVLFRVFDILKPWPVRFFDRMEGPAGVVLDDACAGLMAAALVFLGGCLGIR